MYDNSNKSLNSALSIDVCNVEIWQQFVAPEENSDLVNCCECFVVLFGDFVKNAQL